MAILADRRNGTEQDPWVFRYPQTAENLCELESNESPDRQPVKSAQASDLRKKRDLAL